MRKTANSMLRKSLTVTRMRQTGFTLSTAVHAAEKQGWDEPCHGMIPRVLTGNHEPRLI